jgi:hypothetical protein
MTNPKGVLRSVDAVGEPITAGRRGAVAVERPAVVLGSDGSR